MLAQLHRRYDRLSERWQTAILYVVVGAVLLASGRHAVDVVAKRS